MAGRSQCLLYEVYKHVMWALPNIPRQTSKQLHTIENRNLNELRLFSGVMAKCIRQTVKNNHFLFGL